MTDRYRSGQYGRDHPSWHEEDAPAKAEVVAELLRFGGLSPEVVVDVGCGTGGVLWHLHRRLAAELPDTQWEGWDIAPDAVARARQREGEALGFVCGDVFTSERRADVILCLDVVEHVDDDLSFLERLRDRGRAFVLRLPLDLSVWDVARPRPRLLAVGPGLGHRHLYTRELALQRLADAGYDVVAERYHRAQPLGRGLLDRVRGRGMRAAPHLTVRWLGGYSLVVLAEPRS